MNEYIYIKKFKFATAVSFTVAETIEKRKIKPHRKFDLVIQDASQHFDYELRSISEKNGFSLKKGGFTYFKVNGRTLNTNSNSNPDARIFLNIGPGKTNLPMELDIGDAIISTALENTFMSHPSTYIFYKDLFKKDD